MSILHVGHIQTAIEKRFRGLVDLDDVVNTAQREDSFLTRGLSAFVVAELAGAEDRVAALSVVDSFGDNGIRFIFRRAGTGLLFSAVKVDQEWQWKCRRWIGFEVQAGSPPLLSGEPGSIRTQNESA